MIASQLALQDAINFSMTCSTARAGCHSRINPDSYLAQTFRSPRYLLAAMTDFGCVLSGSRALDYFIPGSASRSSSDWDFLVPCVESSVLGMMDALAHCGVKWDDPLEELVSLISMQRSHSIVLHTKVLMCVSPALFTSQRRPKPTREQREVYEMLHQLAKDSLSAAGKAWVKIEKVSGKPSLTPSGAPSLSNIVKNTNDDSVESATISARAGIFQLTSMGRMLQPERHTDPLTVHGDDLTPDGEEVEYTMGNSLEHLRLINGYITTAAGSRQKVQLFQCHGSDGLPCTPLEFIINTYYATHVQCFISGWSAGHFFYDLAQQKLAINWSLPDAENSRLTRRKCIRKYNERGFRFFMSSSLVAELDGDLNFSYHADMLYTEGRRTRYTLAAYLRTSQAEQQYRMAFGRAWNGTSKNAKPHPLSHEGYSALYAAVNPGIDQGLPDDPAHGPHSLKPKAESAARRLGDKGTLLVRFHRLQKAMWTGSICPYCSKGLINRGTLRRDCVQCDFDQTRMEVDELRVLPVFRRREWEKFSFGHFKTLCQSLDMFRWRVSNQDTASEADGLQLRATEPVLPHMARWHYPSSVSMFGNDSRRQPVFMDILAAERASAGQRRSPLLASEDAARHLWYPHRSMGTSASYTESVVSGPRAWSLRDILALGMVNNTVPNADDYNVAGVSATAVAQACVPWGQRGKVRVRGGKHVVLAADQINDDSVLLTNGANDVDAYREKSESQEEEERENIIVVESREEQWAYNLYLLTAALGTCMEAKCRPNLISMRPPQI